MTPSTPKPIIFLAFANDKQDTGAGFLRGLTTERNGIRDALLAAQESHWCDVIVEPDVTIDRIFNIFQNKNYQDRIAVFHYGGHAGSYELLLESATGKTKVAHSEGLVSFLAHQRGLQLVFLNGCCSEAQAQQLSDAGVPAVVGTTKSIDDTAATGLAVRFYKGLAAGTPVERAWTEAIDQLKTERGTGNFRSFRLREEDEPRDTPTWKLLFREDAEPVKAWNLPEAAHDPLFGLELPSSYYRRLPRSPFPGFRPFLPEEAALFRGRGADIRNVYTQLQGLQSVVLYTGKAGVGKTSLLQAGLSPRLGGQFTVHYLRYQPSGLTGSLTQALQELCEQHELPPVKTTGKAQLQAKIAELQKALPDSTGFARQVLEVELKKLVALDDETQLLSVHWRRVEEKTGRPLLLLLDQVEEAFPDSPSNEENSSELAEFVEALQGIFNQNEEQIHGKLLLSYREELHRLIRDAMQSGAIPFTEITLPPLDFAGITEVMEGIVRHPATRDQYRLNLEKSGDQRLPEIIADDLLEDQESPIAPILQIVLSEMWRQAVRENANAPQFTIPHYQQLKQSGAFLSSFYQAQIERLQQWQERVVESGLVLDLLYRHTSPSGAPEMVQLDRLHTIYEDRRPLLDQLIAQCKQLYLLTNVQQESTTLLHSFLAPVVIQEYSNSLRPGQQAARILNSKKTGTNEPLDDADLALVELGKEGMRLLTPEEERLLEVSREYQAQRERDRRRNRLIRNVLVAIVCVVALIAAWQWWVSDQNFRESRANELAFLAKEIFPSDNTRALDLAGQAYAVRERNPATTATQTLSEVFHSQELRPFYSLRLSHLENVNSAVFSPDGQFILTASEDGFAKLWDRQGKLVREFPHQQQEVQSAAFSPNGNLILTLSDQIVRLWNRKGDLLDSLQLPEDELAVLDNYSTDGAHILTSFATSGDSPDAALLDSLKAANVRVTFSPATRRILLQTYDYTTQLSDWQGGLLRDSVAVETVWADFSPDGKQFLTVSVFGDTSSVIRFWDQDGRFRFEFPYPSSVIRAEFSPDGTQILTAAKDQTARLWDFSRLILHRLPHAGTAVSAVTTAAFSPDGIHLLTATYDGLVRLWDEQGRLVDSLKHEGAVNSAVFSADGRHVLTSARDATARIWTPGEAKIILLQHDDEVNTAVFSPDGSRILTSSEDSTAGLWSANGAPIRRLKHTNKVSAAVFSPDGRRILTVAPRDSAAFLWDESGALLHTFRHEDQIRTAVFSPDGRRILTAAADNTARLWSANGDSLQLFRHDDPVDLAVFSPDGKRILTSSNGQVSIWDDRGRLRGSFSHMMKINYIDFSPDGKQILTASADESAQLHDFRGNLLAGYDTHGLNVNRAVFSPDGKKIVTADDEGYARIWWTPGAIYAWLKTAPVYRE